MVIERRAVVLDASAAVALVRDEPSATLVRRALADHAPAGVTLLVPSLFWIEVTNSLLRRHRYGASEAMEAVAHLDRLGIETIELDRPGVLAVLAATADHGLTAYDAVYLALTDAADAELLTLDDGLAAAAGERAVPLGERRLGERPPAYRLGTWRPWPGADEYLAAIRDQLSASRR